MKPSEAFDRRRNELIKERHIEEKNARAKEFLEEVKRKVEARKLFEELNIEVIE